MAWLGLVEDMYEVDMAPLEALIEAPFVDEAEVVITPTEGRRCAQAQHGAASNGKAVRQRS